MTNQNTPQPPRPFNHLVLGILSTILCCNPIGIVSIIFASQVNSKYDQGDYEGAKSSAKKAMIFWIVAVAVTLIAGIAYFVYAFYVLGDNFNEIFEEAMREAERQQELQEMNK